MSKRIPHNPLRNPWDLTGESIETLARITILMAEANHRFYTRQIEAAEAATAENSRQLKSLLKKTGEIAAALEQWSGDFQTKMASFAVIGGAWRKITLQTLTEVNELLESSSAVSGATGQNQKPGQKAQKTGRTATGRKVEVPVERRFMATMIAFPERRSAAMIEAAAADTHGTARSKRSA